MSINPLLNMLATKRKVFISYHHDGDQWYYNEFSRFFADNYDVVQDNSLDRLIDSNNVDYVMQRIRDKHITGTSCTIVLCGAETPYRKYIDWEIKATLDKAHGLIGINLPSNLASPQSGKVTVPDRLHENISSTYALWLQWNDLNGGPNFLRQCIEVANSKQQSLIKNNLPLKTRNGV